MVTSAFDLNDLKYPVIVATFGSVISDEDWSRYHTWLFRNLGRGWPMALVHDHTAGGFPSRAQLQHSLARANEITPVEAKRVVSSFIVTTSREVQDAVTSFFWLMPNPIWPFKVVPTLREALKQASEQLHASRVSDAGDR